MEEEYNDVMIAIDQAKELIIKLSGNMQWAQKCLCGTEAEKDYNRVAICVDDFDVVGVLHGLAYAEISVEQMKDGERLD